MIYVWALTKTEGRKIWGICMQIGEHEEEKKINAEWRFLARRVLMICETIDRTAIEEAASGAVGLETLLPAALRLYHSGDLSLPALFRAMALNPARRLGLDTGRLAGLPVDGAVRQDVRPAW